MSTSFPTSAESVDAWMHAINMARYTEQLKAAGITQARAPKKPIIQKSRRAARSARAGTSGRRGARACALCVCVRITSLPLPPLPPLQPAQVSQLCLLADEQLKQMGVSLPGHRKRLIQASMALVPPPRSTPSMTEASTSSPMDTESTVSAPDASDEPWETRRFNSTSSLYINSTITRPDTDEIIFCVSVVIYDRIVQGEGTGADERRLFSCFSEENNPMCDS